MNESVYFGFRRTIGDASRVRDNEIGGVPGLLVPTRARDLHFASAADFATDWNVSNPTHPTFYVHSETTPATNYGTLAHNGTDFVVTAGAGGLRLTGAVLVTTSAEIEDNILFTLGSDNDIAMVNRSTTLAATTALTGVIVGTPVTPAIAANSLIVSNVTADGDILLAAQTGGNSQAWVWVDSSAGLAQLLGAGVAVLEWTATKLEVPDSILLTLGSDNDGAMVNRASVLNANTALTGVVVGTVVAQAVAANSLLIGNITADGDVAMYTQTGGNSNQFLFADASAKVLYFGQTGWAVNVLEGAVKVTLGTVSAFGTTQPTNTLVLRVGTAPAGAITTAVGLFTDGTTMKKIIADGTVSDVQT